MGYPRWESPLVCLFSRNCCDCGFPYSLRATDQIGLQQLPKSKPKRRDEPWSGQSGSDLGCGDEQPCSNVEAIHQIFGDKCTRVGRRAYSFSLRLQSNQPQEAGNLRDIALLACQISSSMWCGRQRRVFELWFSSGTTDRRSTWAGRLWAACWEPMTKRPSSTSKKLVPCS